MFSKHFYRIIEILLSIGEWVVRLTQFLDIVPMNIDFKITNTMLFKLCLTNIEKAHEIGSWLLWCETKGFYTARN